MVEHKREAAELQTHMWKRERKVEKTLKGQEEMKLPEGCERKGGKTLRDWGAVVWEKEKKKLPRGREDRDWGRVSVKRKRKKLFMR